MKKYKVFSLRIEESDYANIEGLIKASGKNRNQFFIDRALETVTHKTQKVVTQSKVVTQPKVTQPKVTPSTPKTPTEKYTNSQAAGIVNGYYQKHPEDLEGSKKNQASQLTREIVALVENPNLVYMYQ